jgi:serine/threonine protein kinase
VVGAERAAPEVVTRFKEGYDKACDIWSLGVIMYILLCGYAPFWGSTAQEILRRVKTSKVRPDTLLFLPDRIVFTRPFMWTQVDFPDREWKHISPKAKELVEKMLNRNSSMRPTAGAQAMSCSRPDCQTSLAADWFDGCVQRSCSWISGLLGLHLRTSCHQPSATSSASTPRGSFALKSQLSSSIIG